jgi:Rrf2 family protein
MKLSRTALYAIQAVIRLANTHGTPPVSCRQIALEGQMPVRFLMHIMRRLARSGVVISTRGVEGGYKLARPPQAITLLEVFEASGAVIALECDGEVTMPAECLVRLNGCLGEAADAARKRLSAVRIPHLVGNGRRRRTALAD